MSLDVDRRALFNPVQNTQTIKERSKNIDIKSLI